MVGDYEALQKRNLLLKKTFKAVREEARTLYLTRNLDAETTTAFIKRCRAEGITVNSAFTVIANFALVDVLVYGGLEQDSYSIRSMRPVNTRRYWKGNSSQYLGCHLTLLDVILETPRNFSENFWSYAKPIDEKLQMKTKSGYSIQMNSLKELLHIFFQFLTPHLSSNSVSLTWDMTKMVTEGGDHVQVVHLLRTADVSRYPFILDNFLHTLHGRFTHTLVYNTSFNTTNTAKLYFEKVDHYLHASLEI